MNIVWKKLLPCLALPLAVGGLSAFLVRGGMEDYRALALPPLSPPGWLFPTVWTVLFLLMGTASYLASVSGGPKRPVQRALRLYAMQLAVNFLWPILFFGLGRYLLSFFWLLLLWLLIIRTVFLFFRLSRPAGLLLLPYLLWVTFAGYLNLGVYLLN